MINEQILEHFSTEGKPVSCTVFGNGHINKTYLVTTDADKKYILQLINTTVFHDPEGMMHNMTAVTEMLRNADPDPRHTLRVIPLRTGEAFYRDENGDCWRLVNYIENSYCPESHIDMTVFERVGFAFGRFQGMLDGFPARELCETIPLFHDTPNRYKQLKQAISLDRAGRVKDTQEEIAFYLSKEKYAPLLTDAIYAGRLPLRVVHNDTKANNVALDKDTDEVLCVLDLDTVMPGCVGYDFGDAIRFGASTAAEDEKDLDQVALSMPLFTAFAKGFLAACGSKLTPAEAESLPVSALIMTLECGSRFLADHLNGDIYFGIHRPGHNLDRARTQMKLVQDMENKMEEMTAVVRELYRNVCEG